MDGIEYVGSAGFQQNARSESLKWDKEWIRYFSSGKDYSFYFYNMDTDAYALSLSKAQIAKTEAAELFAAKIFRDVRGGVWAKGNDLVDKNLLEMGCGPGIFGRIAGRFTSHYTGIDISPFALRIAELTSPAEKCTYVHLFDSDRIKRMAKSFDVAVGRHFFIHHNYEDSLWILKLLRDLVKPGGIILADFFYDPTTIDGARRRSAGDELNDDHPSTLFTFHQVMIENIARDAGLDLLSVDNSIAVQRNFARFGIVS